MMMSGGLPGIRHWWFWHGTPLRFVYVLLLSFVWFGLANPVVLAAPDTRGEAQVGVVANLTDPSMLDHVSIRILDNADRQKLENIAYALAAGFHASPQNMAWGKEDPKIITDSGVELNFDIPVLPRGERDLPVGPFIEAFAPHVSRLRIVYVVEGPFTYEGYQSYDHPDVSFTVDDPEKTGPGAPIELAFYGVNAIIRNPDLAAMPELPDRGDQTTSHHTSLWMILAIAGLVGAVIGTVLAIILSRMKAAAGNAERTSIGGKHG